MIDQARRQQLASALAAVRHRISQACLAANRDPHEVRLLAVTKNFPAEDVLALASLGLTEFAESRDQEATPKVTRVMQLATGELRWHFIGRLQRNKARSVVKWAAEVQSVDSAALVSAVRQAVNNAVQQGDRDHPLSVLVQVSLDGDPTRGGCRLDELGAIAEKITQTSELTLRGVMAIAPRTMDPSVAFAILAQAAADLRADYPMATEVSSGMSGDLEAAIAHGSTCVRVGTALLGDRQLASMKSP